MNHINARLLVISSIFLPLLAGPLRAQYAKLPDTYTIARISYMSFNGMNIKETNTTYRDGDRAMVEVLTPANPQNPKGIHTMGLYHLKEQKSLNWDILNPGTPCTPGTFSGDWGDPTQWLSGMFGPDLSPLHPQDAGADTVAGRKAKRMILTGPDGQKVKIWVGTQYGLLLRMGTIDKNGQFSPNFEVTKVSLSEPPASVFAVPAHCGK